MYWSKFDPWWLLNKANQLDWPDTNHKVFISITRPPSKEDQGYPPSPPPPHTHTFSEIVLCQGWFPGNSLLCLSLKYPVLFWPRHSHNLVGDTDRGVKVRFFEMGLKKNRNTNLSFGTKIVWQKSNQGIFHC